MSNWLTDEVRECINNGVFRMQSGPQICINSLSHKIFVLSLHEELSKDSIYVRDVHTTDQYDILYEIKCIKNAEVIEILGGYKILIITSEIKNPINDVTYTIKYQLSDLRRFTVEEPFVESPKEVIHLH